MTIQQMFLGLGAAADSYWWLFFGNPASGYLKIGVNKDFEKNHPKAFNIAKQMNFSGPDIDKMANYVDTDGMEIPEAAQQWLKDHKSKWEKWIK